MALKFTIFASILFVMAGARKPIPDILEFFPEVNNDLRRVTWGHAINSNSLLNNAIEKETYMMLEADVSKGHLLNETEPSKLIPIMAHPPHNTSDISLEMWIDKVIEANKMGQKMGVKLDFKNLDIVITSLEILMKKSSDLTFPLWLNADILKGPGGKTKTPIDADIFLSLCTEFFPEATLSLGWTTEFIPGTDQRYTTAMVEEMVYTLERNNVEQPVTFPLRAAFVGASLDALDSLDLDVPNATYTVWTSPTDEVDVSKLAEIQTTFESHSLFFDLPEEMVEGVIKEGERLKEEASARSSFAQPLVVMTIICVIASVFAAKLILK